MQAAKFFPPDWLTDERANEAKRRESKDRSAARLKSAASHSLNLLLFWDQGTKRK
jgi:hypothetical protein